jgi:hypothetical protein
MAGDVLVSVVEGRMIVEGDELGNQIAITAGPEPGSYAVHGLDGTNVILQPPPVDPAATPGPAGVPMSTVVVHGVRSAGIGMGDGDDRVVLREVNFRGDVGIRMGEGDDQVIVGPALAPMPEPAPLATAGDEAPPPQPALNIGGSLRIGTGAGDDRVHVGRASIRGTLDVATDGDDDSVVLGIPPNDPPAEAATIVGAEEPVVPAIPNAALRVAGGIRVHLGEGNDALVADLVHAAGGMLADGGLGDDHLGVHASRIGRAMVLLGGEGEGEDHVVVDHVSANLASIMTGAGNDNVRIVDSVFHLLAVQLGDGNDTLAVEKNEAQSALLLGGEGEDRLLGLHNNRFRRQVVRGFELPVMDGGGAV